MQSKDLIERYHRQLLLPNFDISAQETLRAAKVLIMGCGGLGVPVIQYLAAAGIGHFSFYDPDLIELSNLHRQPIYRECDIGKSKAQRAAEFILELDKTINVSAKEEWVSIHNVQKIVAGHDIIIDCMDGIANKFLVNDACVLEKRALIHGSAIMMEGRLFTIIPTSACLRCFFNAIPEPQHIPNCSEVGILGPVVGTIGTLMALEAIKIITKLGGSNTNNYLIAKFLQAPTITHYTIEKNPACLACGDTSMQCLVENNYVRHVAEAL